MSRMVRLQLEINRMAKLSPSRVAFTTNLLGWNYFMPMTINICSQQQFCNDILYLIGESWQYKILKRKCVWSFSLKPLRVALPHQLCALLHLFSDKVKLYLLSWFLGGSQGLNILQKPKLHKVIWISGWAYIRDYSNPSLIFDYFAWILSASNYTFLSPCQT